MFTVIKPFEIHKKCTHHDISCKGVVVKEGFDVSVGVMRILPFLGAGNNPHTLSYDTYDRGNPDDFFAYNPYFVASYMTILVFCTGHGQLSVVPALLMTIDEVVDKRVKTCYDVLKAKQM